MSVSNSNRIMCMYTYSNILHAYLFVVVLSRSWGFFGLSVFLYWWYSGRLSSMALVGIGRCSIIFGVSCFHLLTKQKGTSSTHSNLHWEIWLTPYIFFYSYTSLNSYQRYGISNSHYGHDTPFPFSKPNRKMLRQWQFLLRVRLTQWFPRRSPKSPLAIVQWLLAIV